MRKIVSRLTEALRAMQEIAEFSPDRELLYTMVSQRDILIFSFLEYISLCVMVDDTQEGNPHGG